MNPQSTFWKPFQPKYVRLFVNSINRTIEQERAPLQYLDTHN